MIGQEVMDRLREHIGKKVYVRYVNYGRRRTEQAELKSVHDFVNIEVGCLGLPFVGYGCAVQQVWAVATFDILYENDLIPDNYDARGKKEIGDMTRRTFGVDVVRKLSEQRQAYEQDYAKRQAASNKAARKKAPNVMTEGAKHVKPELVDEWKRQVAKNTDGYGLAVMEATVAVMKVLSKKSWSSPQRALDAVEGMDLTGFMMGCVAQAVTYYHPKGEKFRKFWNKKHGVKSGEGVVNPAIMTFSSDR